MSNGEVKRTRLNRLLRGTPQKRELNASSATYEVNGKDSNVSVNMRFTGLYLPSDSLFGVSVEPLQIALVRSSSILGFLPPNNLRNDRDSKSVFVDFDINVWSPNVPLSWVSKLCSSKLVSSHIVSPAQPRTIYFLTLTSVGFHTTLPRFGCAFYPRLSNLLIMRLRFMCRYFLPVREDGNIKDFDVREKETFANEADVDAGKETSGYAKFPILISEPGGQISHVDEPTVDQEEPRLDFNFAVNKWLLRQLRMSPLEVNLLSRTYELQYGMINEREKWQHDLLRL
ncbi:hypothetical protein ACEPPN_004505 [Leptodophora sp. 'Broadleaf-Isolate-01']